MSENVNKTSDEKSEKKTRQVNTSNTSKSAENLGKQGDRKEYIQVNFLIIKEIFELLKPKSILKTEFYKKIIVSKDPLSSYHTLVNNGEGDYKKIAKNLADYNIPIDYFSEQYIEADPKIIEVCNDHIKDDELCPIEICNDIIEEYIFTIKNPDGSLLIDCIFNIIHNIKPNQQIDGIENLSENIIEATPTTRLSLNKIKNYYKNIANLYVPNKDGIIPNMENIIFPDMPKDDISDKKFYITESKDMSFNLFMIREFYRLFSIIDAIPNYMENFYNYLSVSESEYNQMINNGTILTRELLRKLEPFKYPASCFRSESTTRFKISASLDKACKSKNIDLIRTILKLDICYRKDIVYFPLVIPTYSLIRHIELYNSFGRNGELLENYIMLRNNPNHQE